MSAPYKNRHFTLLLCFLLCSAPLFGVEERPGATLPRMPSYLARSTPSDLSPPETLSARSAVVLDVDSDALLYEKEADLVLPPASLTKLMTVHLALIAAEEGAFPLDERVPVPPEAWSQNQPLGSSLMFLGPGQQVSGEELLYGLAVSSGNDAAVAVALLVSGSEEAFVEEMNREARRLGYRRLSFHEPAGLNASNRATARELADFAAFLIERHPGILDYFSLPSFTYPKPENLINGNREHSITQWNRNTLLESYPGADGFKTGFIEASQYNMVATAKREGRRIVTVLLGVPGSTHAEGGYNRAREAAMLMDYGYEAFEVVTPSPPELPPLRVYGGVTEEAALRLAPTEPIALPRGSSRRLRGSYTVEEYRWAPVEAGVSVGTVEYTLSGEPVLIRTVETADAVGEDGVLGRIYDGLLLLTLPLIGDPLRP